MNYKFLLYILFIACIISQTICHDDDDDLDDGPGDRAHHEGKDGRRRKRGDKDDDDWVGWAIGGGALLTVGLITFFLVRRCRRKRAAKRAAQNNNGATEVAVGGSLDMNSVATNELGQETNIKSDPFQANPEAGNLNFAKQSGRLQVTGAKVSDNAYPNPPAIKPNQLEPMPDIITKNIKVGSNYQ